MVNFLALLYTVALVGVTKTAFVSVGDDIVVDFSVSFHAVVTLTGIPLMASALAGFASLVVSRIWGKRPVYLASVAFLLIGVAWNASKTGSYAQLMAARMFQGLGWGAFDTLVVASIQDTFFVCRHRLFRTKVC
jgi:MFS family permease